MSGSFVLRSGVGTQMLMVSSSRDDREVGRGVELPACVQRLDVGGGDVRDVGHGPR